MILQIAVGFNYSSVYKNLFEELENQGIEQCVYVPQHYSLNKDSFKATDYKFKIYMKKTIKKYDKFLYHSKNKKVLNDISKTIDLDKVKLIHAHSLFSDGGIAYEIHKKYDIPYVVAIRDMDLNKYYRYAKHLKKYAKEILDNAERIIFISPAYKETLFNKYVKGNSESLLKKSLTIPNGVNDFWHHNYAAAKKSDPNRNLKLLFVGKVIKRKNLKTVIEVTNLLNENNRNVTLDIVGDGKLLNKYKKKYNNSNINFIGTISDINEMKKKYLENDILVVPSFTETFGLVYIESMRCGTPVIFSENQGIDGYFRQGRIGYSVNPNSKNEIIKAIKNIDQNYSDVSKNSLIESKRFNWNDITYEYKELYANIL